MLSLLYLVARALVRFSSSALDSLPERRDLLGGLIHEDHGAAA